MRNDKKESLLFGLIGILVRTMRNDKKENLLFGLIGILAVIMLLTVLFATLQFH